MKSIKFGIVNQDPKVDEKIELWNKGAKKTVVVKNIEKFQIEKAQIFIITDEAGNQYWVQVKTGIKMKMFLFEATKIIKGENLRVTTLITGKKINIGQVLELKSKKNNVLFVKTIMIKKENKKEKIIENCFFVAI